MLDSQKLVGSGPMQPVRRAVVARLIAMAASQEHEVY